MYEPTLHLHAQSPLRKSDGKSELSSEYADVSAIDAVTQERREHIWAYLSASESSSHAPTPGRKGTAGSDDGGYAAGVNDDDQPPGASTDAKVSADILAAAFAAAAAAAAAVSAPPLGNDAQSDEDNDARSNGSGRSAGDLLLRRNGLSSGASSVSGGGASVGGPWQSWAGGASSDWEPPEEPHYGNHHRHPHRGVGERHGHGGGSGAGAEWEDSSEQRFHTERTDLLYEHHRYGNDFPMKLMPLILFFCRELLALPEETLLIGRRSIFPSLHPSSQFDARTVSRSFSLFLWFQFMIPDLIRSVAARRIARQAELDADLAFQPTLASTSRIAEAARSAQPVSGWPCVVTIRRALCSLIDCSAFSISF